MANPTITITATGITVSAPLVAGEPVAVTASGLSLAEGAALTLALSSKKPNALLASCVLAESEETPGTWTGILETASRQMAVIFANAAADATASVVLELLDTVNRDSLVLLVTPIRNSALIPSSAPCAVEPVYIPVPGGKGDKGDAGDAATIAVGTTTTLPAGSSATVENVGTSSAAVLNFGIPGSPSGGGVSSVDGFAPDEQGNVALPSMPVVEKTLAGPLVDGAVNLVRIPAGSHATQVSVPHISPRVPISRGGGFFAVLVVDNSARETRPADIVFLDNETEFRPVASSSVEFDETGAIPVPPGECRTVLLTATSDNPVDVFVIGVF